jgi:hypothetical protein
MKTFPLIALTMVMVTVYSCEKVLHDPSQKPLSSSPTGPKRDSTQITDTTKPGTKDTVPTPPFPQQTASNNSNGTPPTGCPLAPIYGDTIIFTQPTSGPDYIVNPVNAAGPGKYFAWPVGMVIDQNTGAIDLTKSQTGMLYEIGFVATGTTDTCLSRLIVGGAAYYDSVYVIADGQTKASPYFEANPYLPNICAGGGCTFDVNGAAAAQKVIVNKTTGVIDLQKTLDGSLLSLGGAFGLLPQNGTYITTNIYYKLNDPSNQALQSIAVQIEYYDSKSSINSGLLSGILGSLNNLLSGNLISTSANPRPPIIVITRRR